MCLIRRLQCIAGITDITNTLVSKGGTAHAQGSVTLNKLPLVKGGAPSGVPVLVDFAVDYNLANSTGTLAQGAIKIGKATVKTCQGSTPDWMMYRKAEADSAGNLFYVFACLPATGQMSPAERKKLIKGLENLTGLREGPNNALPHGTRYDYDPILRRAVEIIPSGGAIACEFG